MQAILILSLCACGILANPVEQTPTPEELDALLAERNYEKFSRLLDISNPELVIPSNEEQSRHEAMYNEELFEGDLLLSSKQMEQARQGVRLEKYPTLRWPNHEVPYVISRLYNETETEKIVNGINEWNRQVENVKLTERNGERDYVYIFSGRGCYAYLGRRGRLQVMSLQRNGCLTTSTVLHEFEHTIGIHHEQNRYDRDEYVKVLWENIPPSWQRQYEKTDEEDFNLLQRYDYYSIMHYPMRAPGTGKPAFEILQEGIDESRIGNEENFTPIDLLKIEEYYSVDEE